MGNTLIPKKKLIKRLSNLINPEPVVWEDRWTLGKTWSDPMDYDSPLVDDPQIITREIYGKPGRRDTLYRFQGYYPMDSSYPEYEEVKKQFESGRSIYPPMNPNYNFMRDWWMNKYKSK